MGTLIVRRLVTLVPTLLLVSIGVFALSLTLRAGLAAEARAGGGLNATAEAVERSREQLRLDDPVVVRYGNWLLDALQFDLGSSFVTLEARGTDEGSELVGVPVTELIFQVMPRTLSLVAVSIVFVLATGIPLGIIGGVRPGSLSDRLVAVVATIGLAVPSFLVGMLLIWWVAVARDWFPAVGYLSLAEGGFWGWLRHLLVPSFALALGPAVVLARQLRGALVDVMGSTYIRTAWSKGLPVRVVVLRHALRNSASAPLTVFGLTLTSLLGGTVIIESLFGINGMGSLIVSATRSNDVPVLQGVIVLFVIVNVAVNLLIDVLYTYLNPKVHIR
jgi:peptide/nickel transport system permease protein